MWACNADNPPALAGKLWTVTGLARGAKPKNREKEPTQLSTSQLSCGRNTGLFDSTRNCTSPEKIPLLPLRNDKGLPTASAFAFSP